MADQVLTKQKLINADEDLGDLEEVLNGPPGKLVKTRLGREVYTLASVPQINTMTREEVNAVVAPKANKADVDTALSDVDTALSNLSTAASKYYSTLAEANQYISSIGVNQLVYIGSYDGNEGLYYRASPEATSLTKSAYDPLTQAKVDATTKANAAEANAKTYIDSQGLSVDVSKLSNNYSLSLSEAIVLVPIEHRKKNTVIRINNAQEFQFKGDYTEARFFDIRYWFNIRGIKKDNAKNIISNGVIHHGFVIHNGTTTYYNENNKVLIGELDRDYTSNLRVPQTVASLGINSTVWLDGDFNVIGAISGYSLANPPVSAKYYALNLVYFNGTALISNEDIIQKSMLPRTGSEVNTLLSIQNEVNVQRSKGGGLIEYTDSRGGKFLQPEKDIFIRPSTLVSLNTTRNIYVYLSELINSVDVFFKQTGSVNVQTGKLRRVFVSYFSSQASGQATIRLSVEDHIVAGLFKEYPLATTAGFDNTNLADSDVVYMTNTKTRDPFITVGINLAKLREFGASIVNTFTLDAAEIRPNYIRDRFDNWYKYRTCKISTFDTFDVEMVTNYTYVPPESKTCKKVMNNGRKVFKLDGDAGKRQQQCALFGEVSTRTIDGLKTLNIIASTDVDGTYTMPELTTFQVSSGTYDVLGDQYSQYIHPDLTYSQSAIAGFKYHMINSIYPYANPNYEDAEIFVSNDALNWQRVPSATEFYTGDLSIKLPATYWDVGDDRKNLFMPIPKIGAVMQFATDTADANNTVTQILNHDPFCLYLNGYIYYYCIYNLGLTGSTTTQHRYTFCYRTNDYATWEVVREDGTWYPYNQANAALMFSKTNGVRNHMRYRNSVSANEAAPQLVRVSDTEYYYYIVDLNDTIHRYRGTSPTQFDFSNKETITFSGATIDRIWHCAVEYIDGKFYLIYGGRLCESTDGVSFNVPFAPFFYVGMNADLYKPSFTLDETGKVKLAYSLQPRIAVDHSFDGGTLGTQTMPTTVCCEFPSLSYIKEMGVMYRKDAFVDLVLSVSNEKTDMKKVYRFFNIKSTKKIKGLVSMDTGDLVSATVYLNTRSNGSASFNGLILDDRS